MIILLTTFRIYEYLLLFMVTPWCKVRQKKKIIVRLYHRNLFFILLFVIPFPCHASKIKEQQNKRLFLIYWYLIVTHYNTCRILIDDLLIAIYSRALHIYKSISFLMSKQLINNWMIDIWAFLLIFWFDLMISKKSNTAIF